MKRIREKLSATTIKALRSPNLTNRVNSSKTLSFWNKRQILIEKITKLKLSKIFLTESTKSLSMVTFLKSRRIRFLLISSNFWHNQENYLN